MKYILNIHCLDRSKMLHHINNSQKCNMQKKCTYIDNGMFLILMGLFSVWIISLTFYQLKFFAMNHYVETYVYSKCMFNFSFFLNLSISLLAITCYFDFFFFSLSASEKSCLLKQLRKENCIVCIAGFITFGALVIDLIYMNESFEIDVIIFVTFNFFNFFISMMFFCSSIISFCIDQKKYHEM